MSIGIDVITALVSASTNLFTDSIVEKIVDLTREAKQEYERKAEIEQDILAEKRHNLLEKLNILRTRAILQVSDHTFAKRILPVVLAQTIRIYEAVNEIELDMIADTTSQVESFLDRYTKDQNHRKFIRSIAVGVSIILFVAIFAFAVTSPRIGIDSNYVIPIIQLPIYVLVWSAIGSTTSILYRFNLGGDNELSDPLRWLVTRPLTGIMMGAFAYLALRIGFVATTPNSAPPSTGTELIWLLCFLVGFSDRFSDTVLKSLVGKFGGESDADLLNPSKAISDYNILEVLETWSDELKNMGGSLLGKKENQLKRTDTNPNPETLTQQKPHDMSDSNVNGADQKHEPKRKIQAQSEDRNKTKAV